MSHVCLEPSMEAAHLLAATRIIKGSVSAALTFCVEDADISGRHILDDDTSCVFVYL